MGESFQDYSRIQYFEAGKVSLKLLNSTDLFQLNLKKTMTIL